MQEDKLEKILQFSRWKYSELAGQCIGFRGYWVGTGAGLTQNSGLRMWGTLSRLCSYVFLSTACTVSLSPTSAFSQCSLLYPLPRSHLTLLSHHIVSVCQLLNVCAAFLLPWFRITHSLPLPAFVHLYPSQHLHYLPVCSTSCTYCLKQRLSVPSLPHFWVSLFLCFSLVISGPVLKSLLSLKSSYDSLKSIAIFLACFPSLYKL